MNRIAHNRTARDELDSRVKSIDWNPAALQYGSTERKMVASWLFDTDLIIEELYQRYPVPSQRAIMLDYVTTRLYEKITGQAVESNQEAWNMDGLWDPTINTSFCGWARRTAVVIAKWNAKRVLHSREIAESTLQDDGDEKENTTPLLERRATVDLTGSASSSVFDIYPTLQVPRPLGADRERFSRYLPYGNHATEDKVASLAQECRKSGWWHSSLNQLDELTAVTLLLAPLSDKAACLLEQSATKFANTTATQALAHEYALSQTAHTKRVNMPELKRALIARAQTDDLLEWQVITQLGTLAARLVSYGTESENPTGTLGQVQWQEATLKA